MLRKIGEVTDYMVCKRSGVQVTFPPLVGQGLPIAVRGERSTTSHLPGGLRSASLSCRPDRACLCWFLDPRVHSAWLDVDGKSR